MLNATGDEAIIALLKCVVGTLSTEDLPKMVEVRRHLYGLIFEMDTFDKNIKGGASAIRAENKGVEIEMLKLLAAIVASPITGHWGVGIFRSVHDATRPFVMKKPSTSELRGQTLRGGEPRAGSKISDPLTLAGGEGGHR